MKILKIKNKIKSLALALLASSTLLAGCEKSEIKESLNLVKDVYEIGKSLLPEKEVNIKNKDIQELINSIEVAEPNYSVKYDREEYEGSIPKFVSPSTGKKQGIRLQSIEKSVHTEKYVNKNNLKFVCPYTGEVITDSSDIEYDHIFSLSQAHAQGAYKWSKEKKNQYAYDMAVGVPSQKTANRIKSDKGPSEYLPDKNKEAFCYSYLLIADKYDLTISPADMATIKEVLKNVENVEAINIYK